MKKFFMVGIVVFCFGIFINNSRAAVEEIAESFNYPLDNYNPGSYSGRVFGCCSPRHLGEDDKRDSLTPVKAIGNGKIIAGGVSGGHCFYGMVVVIEHTLLDDSKITSIYGHLSNREGYKPKLEGIVKKGDIIGYVGHSGGVAPHNRNCYRSDDENGDGASHLHMGIRKGSAPSYWVYYGYAGSTHNEDVDYDASGKPHGGKFTSPKKFIDAYNAEHKENDNDNDGYTVAQGDCNDTSKAINPAALDLCDGVDNNCDNQIDENFQPTDSKVGLGDSCSEGYSDCREWGQYVCSEDRLDIVCDALPKIPENETCDDKDNDCDGQIDEDFQGLNEPCSVGVGECRREDGLGVCLKSDPTKVYCSVAPKQPGEEICDGKDNDCDGETDETCPCASGEEKECGVSDEGECQMGKQICESGVWSVCNAIMPATEICDGKDNNCDSYIDEDDICGCIPDCYEKECGDDGCGGSCGECGAEKFCNAGFFCEEISPNCPSAKDCSGLECGPDPVCGESCGNCALNEICSFGVCECVPDCSGKECGDNGCGGLCGDCNMPETCGGGGSAGICGLPEGSCIIDADCESQEMCEENICVYYTNCANDTECEAGQLCENGVCKSVTFPIGCSDGTAEGHTGENLFACAGGWSKAGLDKNFLECNHDAGNNSSNPSGDSCNIQDLCAVGFEVCRTDEDIVIRGNCPATLSGFFVIRERAKNTDYMSCDGSSSINNFFGCGIGGRVPQDSCEGNVFLCQNRCAGMLPISCEDSFDEEYAKVVNGGAPHGVMCCKY